MTDWAKIAAGIKIGAGETAEGLVREVQAQRNELPSSARLEGVLEQMRDAGRLIGSDQIKNILHVKDLGKIEPYPNGLEAALLSESLITPGMKVFEDHRLFYMPESFDGVANSVMHFKALVQLAEDERKELKPDAKPIFWEGSSRSYKYGSEAWAKSAPIKGAWILTPDIVTADARGLTYLGQSKIIADKFPNYVRSSAQENIMLLPLVELLTGERLYPSCTWGWTSTEAGAFPEHFVFVGHFVDTGFGVGHNHAVVHRDLLGAFIRWNFNSNS